MKAATSKSSETKISDTFLNFLPLLLYRDGAPTFDHWKKEFSRERVSYLSSKPGPEYLPGEFDIAYNYNVLQISEIHAFEEPDRDRREDYCREVGLQVNDYVDQYDVNEIHVMGDTGTYDDVYRFLDTLEPGPEVLIVAGDEDKKSSNEQRETGFYRQINNQDPFDVEVDYRLFDGGFEKEIFGNTLQAAHHPDNSKRDDKLNHPDNRDSSFIDDLFSVKRYTNEQSTRKSPPSLSRTDIAVYDHVHMPYPRTVGDKILIGLGGRRFNYQLKADNMPERSLHLTSFEDDKVHALHFDAEWDEIFEHQIFDQSGKDVEMFDVQTPRGHTRNSGYLPIQSRFHRDHIIREAWEEEEDIPELWRNRDA